MQPGKPSVDSNLIWARRSSVKQLEHVFRGTGNHGPFAANNDRPLHQHGMFQQQIDDGLTAHIVSGIQVQPLKILVLANQVSRCIGKQIKKSCQVLTAYRLFQILDNVELDVTVAQNFQRAPRPASTLIMINSKFFHSGVSRTL
jgi:hypothetical protein